MTLKIPCTPFSRKIILRENHGEPLKLSKIHPLWVILRPHLDGDAVHAGPVSSLLQAHFVVDCDNKTGEKMVSHLSDAGVALHRYHLNAMFRFIWSLGIGGTAAKQAIYLWYNMYHIDEEDYSSETAYRMWQRARRDFDAVFAQKSVTKSHLDVLNLRRPAQDIFHLFSDKEIDSEADKIFAALLAIRPSTPKYVLEQIHQWLYVEPGRRQVRAVAKKFGKSRRRTYVAIERVRGYLKYDAEFAAIVRPTITA